MKDRTMQEQSFQQFIRLLDFLEAELLNEIERPSQNLEEEEQPSRRSIDVLAAEFLKDIGFPSQSPGKHERPRTPVDSESEDVPVFCDKLNLLAYLRDLGREIGVPVDLDLLRAMPGPGTDQPTTRADYLQYISKLRAEAEGKPPVAGGVRPGDKTRPSPESGNVIRLSGQVWHIRYEDQSGAVEIADFPDRADSVLRDLARLLDEPNRRIEVAEFYPPPADKTRDEAVRDSARKGNLPPRSKIRLPFFGRDDTSDDQAMEDYRMELQRLAREIKEARDSYDIETADNLKADFDALSKHVEEEEAARRRGHKKKCGTSSPVEAGIQRLRVGLSQLMKRFRKKGLPLLADHLDKYIENKGGQWWYAPPPDTSWHVSRPEPPSEE
jgi:hypothetical protein